MPSPVSVIRTTARSVCRSPAIATRPPSPVNLMALESTFHMTCWMRLGSASIAPSSPMSAASVIRLASATGRSDSTAPPMATPRSVELI